MNFKKISILLLGILFVQCDKVVELDIPSSEQKIVIYVLGEVGKKTTIRFSRSYGVLETEPPSIKGNLSASLISMNGDTIPFLINGQHGIISRRLKDNMAYKLSFYTKIASGISEYVHPPVAPKIDSVNLSKGSEPFNDGNKVTIYFDKNSLSSQCYALQFNFYKNDSLIDSKNKKLDFVTASNDFIKNNREHSTSYNRFRVVSYQPLNTVKATKMQVKVLSFTDDICLFYERVKENLQNPGYGSSGYNFVPIHSNIPQGYGFYGFYAADSVMIKFQ